MINNDKVTKAISNYYIFTGYHDSKGKLCSYLSPLTDVPLLIDRKSLNLEGEGKYALCKTSLTGAIQVVDSLENETDPEKKIIGRAVKSLGEEPKLIMPPMNVLANFMAAHQDDPDWKDKLCSAVEESGMDTVKEFKLKNIDIRQLKKPKEKPKTDIDTDSVYRKWYREITKSGQSYIRTLVIPRIRAVFFLFTSSEYLKATVHLFRNGRQVETRQPLEVREIDYYEDKDNVDPINRKYGAVAYNTPENLPSGQYKIRVQLDPFKNLPENRWSKNIVTV